MAKKIILASIFLISTILALPSTKEAHWIQLPSVQNYISSNTKSNKFSHHELSLLLSQATIQPKIIKIINNTYEAKPWPIYKQHFLNKKRVIAGKRFLKQSWSSFLLNS